MAGFVRKSERNNGENGSSEGGNEHVLDATLVLNMHETTLYSHDWVSHLKGHVMFQKS